MVHFVYHYLINTTFVKNKNRTNKHLTFVYTRKPQIYKMMSNSAVQSHIRELYNFTVITSHRPLIVTREFCNRNPKVVWPYGYYLAPTD